jgi:hypothetical protein
LASSATASTFPVDNAATSCARSASMPTCLSVLLLGGMMPMRTTPARFAPTEVDDEGLEADDIEPPDVLLLSSRSSSRACDCMAAAIAEGS